MRNLLSFFVSTPYRKEIVIVIIIKLLALSILGLLFFHPVNQSIIKQAFTQRFLSR